ncbi:hypothetical protein SDD30_16300 [Moorella naiadis]|uniref:hypothetical protein n=1 Tax=Moorella naiadis (nom. illeg.) TaxID=3093670 RepID=UPI003D9CBB16
MRLRVKLRITIGRTFFVPHDQLQQGLTGLVYEVFKAAARPLPPGFMTMAGSMMMCRA